MALETATYISQLVAANPTGADPIANADDHLRMIKQVLQNTFPNLSGPVSMNQSQLNTAMPIGGIIMWSGASIPSGWALCNGQTVARSDGAGNITTPSLLDKFPTCAGGSYAVGATGGVATVALSVAQLPPHNHTANTDTQGNHTHHVTGNTGGAGAHSHSLPNNGSVQAGSDNGGAMSPVSTGYGSGRNQNPTDPVGDHGHYFEVDTWAAGNHAHNVFVGSTGSGAAIENRPPFQALYFIMKV
jgi:microcystin-dependent protein